MVAGLKRLMHRPIDSPKVAGPRYDKKRQRLTRNRRHGKYLTWKGDKKMDEFEKYARNRIDLASQALIGGCMQARQQAEDAERFFSVDRVELRRQIVKEMLDVMHPQVPITPP